MIAHDDGTTTVYGHMAKNSIIVRTGDKVEQGQVIGKIGNSGSSTGAHLHFGVMINGLTTYQQQTQDQKVSMAIL